MPNKPQKKNPKKARKVLTPVEKPLEDLAKDFQVWLAGQISRNHQGPFDFCIREQEKKGCLIGYQILCGEIGYKPIGEVEIIGPDQVELTIEPNWLTRKVRISTYSPFKYEER
jgi:hypothetical protein